MKVGETCGCLALYEHGDEPGYFFLERGGCNWQVCNCACHSPPGAEPGSTTDTMQGHPCCTGACLTTFQAKGGSKV